MEAKNAVSGAVVVKMHEVPFAEWMKRCATPAEKESVQLAILQGRIPENAVIHRNKVFMEVPA